jgi:hypothetical protein
MTLAGVGLRVVDKPVCEAGGAVSICRWALCRDRGGEPQTVCSPCACCAPRGRLAAADRSPWLAYVDQR